MSYAKARVHQKYGFRLKFNTSWSIQNGSFEKMAGP